MSLARVCRATIFVSSVFFQVVKHLAEDCLESAQSCTDCWRPEPMGDQTGNEKKLEKIGESFGTEKKNPYNSEHSI